MSGRRTELQEAVDKVEVLPVLAGADLEAAGTAERRLEAWRLAAEGHTQVEIAEVLHVARSTVQRYIGAEAQLRLSRLDNTEAELEKIIGQLEAVVRSAWEKHRISPITSLAGSNYLRLVLDGAREIARLRGFDALIARRGDTGPSRAEIVVKIGGANSFEPVVTIGARITDEGAE